MSLSVSNISSYQPKKNQNVSFGNSLFIIKPEVIGRSSYVKKILMDNGFQIVRKWEGIASRDMIEQHYYMHRGKSFFEKLVKHMSSGRICVLELKGGPNDVKDIRKFTLELRKSFVAEGEPTLTAFHASANKEEAKREIHIWREYIQKLRAEAQKAQNSGNKGKSINTQA